MIVIVKFITACSMVFGAASTIVFIMMFYSAIGEIRNGDAEGAKRSAGVMLIAGPCMLVSIAWIIARYLL